MCEGGERTRRVSSRSVSVAESVKEKVRGGYVQTSKGIGSEAR
jgi:hypothetical protein